MLRRLGTVVGAWIALAWTGAPPAVFARETLPPKTRRPNVLFILTDDQREDTIAAFGNREIRTPNLDRLARSGIVFRNAYCMGGFSPAVCLPSRMMLLRGQSWFTVQTQKEPFPSLGQTLRSAGYVTFHLGKRGNSDIASQSKFEHNHYLEPNDDAERRSGKPGQQIADKAIAFLKDWNKAADAERKAPDAEPRPFFLFLADSAPHDPRVAAPEYLSRYDAGNLSLPKNFLSFHPFNNGELLVRDERLARWPRTPDEIRRHLRDYYAVIEQQDEQYGRIFAVLRDIGAEANTIIVFSSDQGIAIGSHGLMGKQSLYEHSMGVPLIIAGPGIPKGATTDAFAYLLDVFPTLCDLTSTPKPEALEGTSLAPVIDGRATKVRDTIFLAYRDVQRAVIHERWKLIRYPKINRNQLFDLRADPDEIIDLAIDLAKSDLVEQMLERMQREQMRYGDTLALDAPAPDPGDVDLEFFAQQSSPEK